jgi:predicted RNase H-like nuclease (RuvC/YqgF family)
MKVDIMKNEIGLLNLENQALKKKIVELENKITQFQMQQTCKKKNERKAGRKQYQKIEIIRDIFRMYAKGRSLQQIADRLNSEEIPTKAGGIWTKSSIRFILNNKSYIEMGVLSEKEYNLDFY